MITGDGWELMDSKSEHGGRFPKSGKHHLDLFILKICKHDQMNAASVYFVISDSVRCIGGVTLCLGLLYLLLLAIIIAMVGQCEYMP